MSDADKAFFEPLVASIGGGIVGKGMYDAAGAWGGHNPFPGTLVVLTHRLDDQPDPANGFHFVEGLDHALACARDDAGEKDISIGGGADVIRQALAAGVVDTLVISTAPVILGRRQAPLRRLREGPRPQDPLRAPVRVGRAHDVRRGALTVGGGIPGRPGVPTPSASLQPALTVRNDAEVPPSGRSGRPPARRARRPRAPRLSAATNASPPARVATANATPDAEMVRAPPRESAIDRAEELKPAVGVAGVGQHRDAGAGVGQPHPRAGEDVRRHGQGGGYVQDHRGREPDAPADDQGAAR